ncbi:hypothetical protein PV328_000718 [Microctonus aethiopoides]|uniref:Ig-like domain-containing protein n=1 Tax=Microctonus aethiopoides TaxID=144406 RepID=A0AA39FWP2_9HYME|nr:hypothetical protein PV328_000718 [Microctonus aethiopoides]
MRGLVVLIGLLLVVKFVENISGESIHTQTGRSVPLLGPRVNAQLEQCSVEHNGIIYGLYPKINLTGATFAGSPGFCTFFIKSINLDHAGEWKINTIWKDTHNNDFSISNSSPKSVYTNYTIHVEQADIKLLPRDTIDGEDGSYANVYFEDYSDDITKCYIVKHLYHNETIYILGDNGNGTSAGLKLYKKCGVQIPINDTFHGEWKLVRESGDYKMRTGIILIKSHQKTTSSEESHETWRRGSSDMKIEINRIKYCEVERPDGEVIPLMDSKCKYSVEKVSDKHAGMWKVRYFSEFSMNIAERRIVVHVVDPLAINATVTTTKDNMIHILCQTYVNEIEHCFFTTPNGTMINALPGNGNEKYMYYGLDYYSMYETNFAQCGITILQPSSDDYGSWKCTIKEEKSSDIMNALVPIAHLAEKKIHHPYVSTKNVYVKRSDNFTITCKTTTLLDYCWLQSPNGTNYSVTKNRGNLQNYLPYVGEGLSVGVCGASIENADDIHSGNWSCRLGVTGGAEIESIVPVTVTDSYIVPVKKSINIAHDELHLVVNVIPSKEATIQYCRWIRPNGHGFNEKKSNRYLRSQTETSCILTLTDWDSADLGTWSCYVRFSTGSDEEFHTTIELLLTTQNGSYTILNIFSMCLVAITIIGGTIFGLLVYKKRLSARNPTIIYNEFDPSKSGAITMKERPNI